MRRTSCLFLFAAVIVTAETPAVNRHLIGIKQPLTAPDAREPRTIAHEFLAARAAERGLSAGDLAGTYVAKSYSDAHNGVTHFVYRQRFQGVDVINSAWVVNIDAQGRVLNAGGDLYGAPLGAPLDPGTAPEAVRAAVKAINPTAAERFVPFRSDKSALRAGAVRFTAGPMSDDPEGRLVWFAARGKLAAAWQVFVTAEDRVTKYSVIVDAAGHELSRDRMTFFQNPPKPVPGGLVYERESPQPNPTPGTLLLVAPPYAERTYQSFAGDKTASPNGWVTGNQTAGNNAIVGENLLGIYPFTPVTTKAPGGDFSFPLQAGADAAGNPLSYADAANTNLFYWMNRAHDLFYASGFTEAAGNFQANNFERGGVGNDAMQAYTHFGAAAPLYADIDNAFFSYYDVIDGSHSYIAMFVASSGYGGVYTDGSLDSAVMVHEYGHGVSTRLLARGYDSYQAHAMGEAWSDFFALEFLTPEGAPPDGVYPTSQYFFQSWGQDALRTRPYSTRIDVNPLTFADLGKVIPWAEEHSDGEIWFEALWDARAALIAQLGEKEGRKRIRTLVLDGMKLAIPRATMVDMRDAILLADRVSYKGESQSQLWAAFAKRGLGALAYSNNVDNTHVLASFAVPSDKGQIAIYDDPIAAGDLVWVVASDLNNTSKAVEVQLTSTSGDVETISLAQQGSVWVNGIYTSTNVVNRENGTLNLATGDGVNAFYTDYNAPGAVQVNAFSTTLNPYYATGGTSTTYSFDATTERLLTSSASVAKVDLPFAFPFYGDKFRTMFVHREGIITFGASLTLANVGTGCPDRDTLSQAKAIAPLFANLTTQGIAQSGEGIYITRTITDSVTVRWVAETVPVSGVVGSPVNMAATLYDDGRIVFQYGKNTADLGSAYTPSYCGQSPAMGLSPGHGYFVNSPAIPALSNFTLRFDPPFGPSSIPVGTIEAPAAGATVNDVLTVSGLAYDTNSPVYRVDVLVDGVKRATTTPTVSRTDFCTQQNVRGCPLVGYSVKINNPALTPGDHKVQVRVTNSRGGTAIYPAQPVAFKVEAGVANAAVGAIESPAEGDVLTDIVTVRGWAHAGALRVSLVDILIDGISYGPTQYGVRRTDICTPLSPVPASCPSIGFQYSLDTLAELPPIRNGAHTMQIRVRDETGRYTLIPEKPVNFTVKNDALSSVVGAVTSIKPGDKLSGTVTVSGYAYGVGATLLSGNLYVDGYNYGAVSYRQPAPEVCAGLKGVAACPNIGFTYDFDTRRLENGPHVLSLGFATSDGWRWYIPTTGTPVLSVIVDNPKQ